MFWLIGLTVFGLAVATSGLDSGQPDDESEVDEEESEADEEELWGNDLVGEQEDLRGTSENSGGTDENDDESEDGSESTGRQIAEGTSGKDLIFSDGGDDEHFSEIYGNDGNDRIYASDGAKVFGGTGNDMIVLRSVDEGSLPVEVSGDSGSDAFILEGSNSSSATQGVNIISDYHAGEDIVGIVLEDEELNDDQFSGSVSYSLKGITSEVNEDGTLLTMLISRELDPDLITSGDESSTELTHQIFLQGVADFDLRDFVVVNDWIEFAKEFLGPEGYSSVIFPSK